MCENMKIIIFIVFLSLSAINFQSAYASETCEKFIHVVEIKKASSLGYLNDWCKFHILVGNFRNRFISMHGQDNWNKHSWLKDDPDKVGGVKISTFDLDISEVVYVGEVLNSNNMPSNIKVIEIDGGYKFKRKNKIWYLDHAIEKELENDFSYTEDYYKGLKLASDALDINKKPREVMLIFHKYITYQMLKDIL